MNFNYSYEKKKFEQEWEKLESEYKQAGMSDKDIQTMKEFDMQYFRLNRNTILHTYDLQDCEDIENNGNDDFSDIDFRKLEYVTLKEQEKIETHSRFWWIDEIDNPILVQKIKKLSESDLEFITLLVFDGYLQTEMAQFYGIAQQNISKRLKKIKKILK